MYRIVKLPSGFYAVFVGETWIDASSRTEDAARVKAEAFCNKGKKGEKTI